MKRIVSMFTLAVVSLSIVGCARGAQNNQNVTPNLTGYQTNQGGTAGLDPNAPGGPYTGTNPNATIDPNISGNLNITPLPVPEPAQDYNVDRNRVLNNPMSGLAPGTATPGTTSGIAGTYIDGTYGGDGNLNTRATVTVLGGRITDIVLKKMDANGMMTQDENLNLGNTPGGGATSNVGQTTRDLANSMIQAQSPDIVTSTTGDTTLVDDFKLAVRRALDGARR